jgi:hypothetical protein
MNEISIQVTTYLSRIKILDKSIHEESIGKYLGRIIVSTALAGLVALARVGVWICVFH